MIKNATIDVKFTHFYTFLLELENGEEQKGKQKNQKIRKFLLNKRSMKDLLYPSKEALKSMPV